VYDIQRKWVKPKHASAVYGIGLTKLYELLNQGFLETKKIGASRLIGVASLDRLFADPKPVLTPTGRRKAGKERPEKSLLTEATTGRAGAVSSVPGAED